MDQFSVAVSPQLLTGNFNVISIKAATHRELSMRNDQGPFKNKLVRQAVAYTLDRPGIVAALFKGQAVVGNDSPFAPNFRATNHSIPQRAKNIAKAKQLLAQAGVPNGFSTPLLTETTQEMPHFAQIVKQSAAAIGINISLTIETPTKYYGQAIFGKSDWLDGQMSLVRLRRPGGAERVSQGAAAVHRRQDGPGLLERRPFQQLPGTTRSRSNSSPRSI